MVKLHEIYIIVKKRGLPAFHTKFGRTELHPDLVSGLLTAISHFAKELHPGEQKDINLIQREDLVIMIEDGSKTFGAIIADYEDKAARPILKRVIESFEDKFDKELDDLGVNTLVFEKFKDVVVREFGALLVNPFYFPQLLKKDYDLPEDLTKLVNVVDGETNLNEIADSLHIPLEEVCQQTALLESRGIIELKVKIEESDVFSPTEKVTEAFSRETKSHQKIIELFGDMGIDILYALDGKKDLNDIIDELNIPFNQIVKIILFFLDEGFISWVELYPIMRQLTPEKITEMITDSQEHPLAFSLQNICDGTYSLSSVSRKLGVPKDEIKEFLKKFRTYVRWIEKKI